jgi:hypothetical protein
MAKRVSGEIVRGQSNGFSLAVTQRHSHHSPIGFGSGLKMLKVDDEELQGVIVEEKQEFKQPCNDSLASKEVMAPIIDLDLPENADAVGIPTPRYNVTVTVSDFDILCLIGEGAYGKVRFFVVVNDPLMVNQVFQVRHRRNRKLYAMKVMSKEYLIKKKHVAYTHEERNIMSAVTM